MKKIILLAMTFFYALNFVPSAKADSPIYKGLFSETAVSGYDTVSYFAENKAVRGNSVFSTKWNNAEWKFSSEENLNKFKKNPSKYAPQYGGYCAYAAALNKKVSADPKVWKIVDGKLYLNYDQDVKKTWDANRDNFIADANKNWATLQNK